MATSGLILSQVFSAVVVCISRILAFFRQTQSLHNARFASLHELTELLTPTLNERTADAQPSLLFRPAQTRKELGNLLVVAPTRGGKGLAAVSQLLT